MLFCKLYIIKNITDFFEMELFSTLAIIILIILAFYYRKQIKCILCLFYMFYMVNSLQWLSSYWVNSDTHVFFTNF